MQDMYRPKSPPNIHETIAGETIIVNLVSGTYYQLTGVAAEVWEALDAGAPVREIGKAIATRYGEERAADDVVTFVDRLQEHDLVVAEPAATPGAVPFTNGASAGDYHPPEMAIFTDMQDLLLLDPVHEVDESGWPSKPA